MKEYITRRKLVKLFKYIMHKKLKIKLIDDHDCSYEGARYHNEYSGIILNFNITKYEDAEIKLLIHMDTGDCQIWLNSMYFIEQFKFYDKIVYTCNNGDGTYSDFIIEFDKE